MARQASVLLAEQNEDNRTVYRIVLEHFGYTVLEARDAEECMRLVREAPPAVALVRRSLPLGTEWETVRRLRADPAASALKIIGMTANALVQDRLEALEAGCDVYLATPCDPRRVVAEVEKLSGPAAA